MCSVFISEQTATCVTYTINRLVYITEMESVYSAVRTGSLNKAVCASSLKVYMSIKFQLLLLHYTKSPLQRLQASGENSLLFSIYLQDKSKC
jgi:hypothetical protein